ncbi:FAD:protein FMN transferase [Streptomyces sp. SID10815]|uniref:FAD:protein FMN transferase n=1 Tax=Streptomyces sp. SID10815 TaxID=2706027 RepID=UPI001EF1C467|nr:FAD:protein FMN transferase [Streptomyces sp. SID10815]
MDEKPGPRLHRVVHAMGTVFSFTVRDAPAPAVRGALDEAGALLHHVDTVFSPFRTDSAVCRVNRGESMPRAWEPELREVLDLCAEAHRRTNGWFAAWRRDGFDLNDLGKEWAVERAARLLRAAGAEHICLNGGGDIQLHGGPWRMGIDHPQQPDRIAAVIEHTMGALAVATSGPAERGCHIIDPQTHAPPSHGLA